MFKFLFFVVRCIVRIWVRIGVCDLVCQFFVIINELVACDIEFLFRNNVFLWLELRFFWWSYTVVKLFISDFANSCDKNFSCSIVLTVTVIIRFHCVVCNGCVRSFNFFYSVVVNAFLTLLELKFRDLTLPDASLLTVSTTLPVESLRTKLNSLALSSRPSNLLVKLNSTCTGTLFTRFSVGLFWFFYSFAYWVVSS